MQNIKTSILLGWGMSLPVWIPLEIQGLIWQFVGAVLSYYTLKFLNRKNSINDKLKDPYK